ncbi:MAG: hypothetical protein AAGC43_12645 [Bacteroidota bacterium]
MGCNTRTPPLETAKTYYKVLDQSDFETLPSLLADSVISKEIVYETAYSKKGYMELQRWDSVFGPTYKILDIEEVDGKVKAKISKSCPRILFLNGEPIITQETMTFHKGKIDSVVIDDYLVFNAKRWDSVRSKLVNFVDINHKELNGFLYDQTVEGAIKYTKAIDLYKANTEEKE